ILKFNNQSKKLVIPWKDWLTIDWDINEVGEEYRTNKLSKEDGRYVVFLGAEDQWPRYKCYTNIHNYVEYIYGMCVKAKSTSAILKNDFIYVWDKEDHELIIAFEKLADNKCNMSKGLQERIGL